MDVTGISDQSKANPREGSRDERLGSSLGTLSTGLVKKKFGVAASEELRQAVLKGSLQQARGREILQEKQQRDAQFRRVIQNLDLREHSLIQEGPLQLRLNKRKTVDSTSFFLVYLSEEGPEIYELVAPSPSERIRWMQNLERVAVATEKAIIMPFRQPRQTPLVHPPVPFSSPDSLLRAKAAAAAACSNGQLWYGASVSGCSPESIVKRPGSAGGAEQSCIFEEPQLQATQSQSQEGTGGSE
ncbi:Hypothetical predicted protein [Podarcis lilfordi]|uniref:ARHGEF1-like PH domain-containing protein n=1 Tax=Podarcis lilfordi TaxID=74358 RepID=A0AA35PL67_9SAUR|nr:Hypothetical predicted protein [Podarcis lilfordi]